MTQYVPVIKFGAHWAFKTEAMDHWELLLAGAVNISTEWYNLTRDVVACALVGFVETKVGNPVEFRAKKSLLHVTVGKLRYDQDHVAAFFRGDNRSTVDLMPLEVGEMIDVMPEMEQQQTEEQKAEEQPQTEIPEESKEV